MDLYLVIRHTWRARVHSDILVRYPHNVGEKVWVEDSRDYEKETETMYLGKENAIRAADKMFEEIRLWSESMGTDNKFIRYRGVVEVERIDLDEEDYDWDEELEQYYVCAKHPGRMCRTYDTIYEQKVGFR